MVQGHPKLLELADGAAADPEELQARLGEADQAWLTRGTRLDGFLRGETPAASGEDFGAVLTGWTRGAAAGLSAGAELLLRVVCGLEDDDRQPNVLEFVWPRVWERTGQAGPVPDPGGVLAELVARALVVEERDPESGVVVGWRVHPGVADAVRADTAPDVAAAVDDAAADGWLGAVADARIREADEQTGGWLVRAARSAAPYLLRRGRWADLGRVAEEVLARDLSVGAAAFLVPMLDVAVEATRGSGDLELELGRTMPPPWCAWTRSGGRRCCRGYWRRRWTASVMQAPPSWPVTWSTATGRGPLRHGAGSGRPEDRLLAAGRVRAVDPAGRPMALPAD